ncbi:MAG: hypothetical protein ABSE73_32100, partial [Planctomycetota bacterium]
GEDGRSLALDLRDGGKLGSSQMVLVANAEMDRQTKEFTLKLGFSKIVSKPVDFAVLDWVIANAGRSKTKSARAEAAEKLLDDKAFEERKTAVLKKMGLAGGVSASAAPVAAGADGQATKKVVPTTVHVPGRVKTTLASNVPAQAQLQEAQATAGLWMKGLLLGLLFPAVLVAGRVFLFNGGYTTAVLTLEGAVLGLLVGLGLSSGLKQMKTPPGLATVAISVLCLTLAVWGMSLGLRVARHLDFVERSQGALNYIREHPNANQAWGVSEWMAVAYNLSGIMLTFAGAIYVIRSVYLNLERAAMSARHKAQREGH